MFPEFRQGLVDPVEGRLDAAFGGIVDGDLEAGAGKDDRPGPADQAASDNGNSFAHLISSACWVPVVDGWHYSGLRSNRTKGAATRAVMAKR